MRIALILAIALAAGCAKKTKAAAPAAPRTMENTAPGGPAEGAAPDSADEKAGSQTKGDPCDGGETKGK